MLSIRIDSLTRVSYIFETVDIETDDRIACYGTRIIRRHLKGDFRTFTAPFNGKILLSPQQEDDLA